MYYEKVDYLVSNSKLDEEQPRWWIRS